MDLQITCTEDGVTTYPLHRHENYEIIFYVFGTGHLRTLGKDYPFSPGTIIIVPPRTEHGSSSDEGFKNICVSGVFSNLLNYDSPVVMHDNDRQEGRILTELIYNNRYGQKEYINSLCSAYIHFLQQHVRIESDIDICVKRIIAEIYKNAFDFDISLGNLLRNSGYAEDYIRNRFKTVTGKTPVRFLTEIRIKHACYLINIYRDSIPVSQIAERCGFVDYVYFSKKFKEVTGMSPAQYKKTKI